MLLADHLVPKLSRGRRTGCWVRTNTQAELHCVPNQTDCVKSNPPVLSFPRKWESSLCSQGMDPRFRGDDTSVGFSHSLRYWEREGMPTVIPPSISACSPPIAPVRCGLTMGISVSNLPAFVQAPRRSPIARTISCRQGRHTMALYRCSFF